MELQTKWNKNKVKYDKKIKDKKISTGKAFTVYFSNFLSIRCKFFLEILY
jgi:hypothetical protein